MGKHQKYGYYTDLRKMMSSFWFFRLEFSYTLRNRKGEDYEDEEIIRGELNEEDEVLDDERSLTSEFISENDEEEVKDIPKIKE